MHKQLENILNLNATHANLEVTVEERKHDRENLLQVVTNYCFYNRMPALMAIPILLNMGFHIMQHSVSNRLAKVRYSNKTLKCNCFERKSKHNCH